MNDYDEKFMDDFHCPVLAKERNLILVPSPILVIYQGFSLLPLLRSQNLFSNSSSQIIPLCPIPNKALPENGGNFSKDDVKEREYNPRGRQLEDHNVFVEPPSRNRRGKIATCLIIKTYFRNYS
ncbi:Uncharacterized protein Rs2_38795 [Raphanus sativus]|nr:Uncharacterized protein Rs2_38795 [Raphanus sativus]